ncbi:hypothetical protein F5B22DRAFT_491893 [Xylaria bambusicola]|uniref:uncharacterized protein n=1 Tax=Xylaria bambusicola TaxID=326684 RepID=UPI0020089830|nr:uncharacterized protein F5B22DRAFT_491893 [Xylaria bambusicola]KAI0505797.1 hypothetical protein F5B22DRAFT_491893 [Xylaria bambusicola]
MRGILPLRFGTPMQPSSSTDSSSSSPALARRQYVETDDGYVWFWYTTAGVIIKYTIFFAFLLLLVGWVIGGRVHAKRRLRKGLKPLRYHAWLLSRYERAQVDPAYAYPQATYRPVYGNNSGGGGGGADYYGMHSMPPPVYDPTRPPVYDGPPVGSKVDPVQDRQGQQAPMQTQGVDEYTPPAGPPPGR